MVQPGLGVEFLADVQVRVSDERRCAQGGASSVEDRGLAIRGVSVVFSDGSGVIAQGRDAVLLDAMVVELLGLQRTRAYASIFT